MIRYSPFHLIPESKKEPCYFGNFESICPPVPAIIFLLTKPCCSGRFARYRSNSFFNNFSFAFLFPHYQERVSTYYFFLSFLFSNWHLPFFQILPLCLSVTVNSKLESLKFHKETLNINKPKPSSIAK